VTGSPQPGLAGKLRRAGLSGSYRAARRRAGRSLIALGARALREDSSRDPFHVLFETFIERVNAAGPGPRILEVGARGAQVDPRFRADARYVGFDLHPGANVTVTGDAHELSSHFSEPFDAIYAISTIEHLALPWRFVVEANATLRDGGLLFLSTHHAWPLHAMPWDFWRFSPSAFEVLLRAETGFRVLDCALGLPASLVPLGTEASTTGIADQMSSMGISVLAERIAPASEDPWGDIEIGQLFAHAYPETLGP
jgi:SAM-dependent methyltransferase